jgi:hypothetical protein
MCITNIISENMKIMAKSGSNNGSQLAKSRENISW